MKFFDGLRSLFAKRLEASASRDEFEWSAWDASVHESEGQPSRMQRALSQRLKVCGESSASGWYQVTGSKGDIYLVTYGSCSCEDFGRRHLPCKHMYALAMQTAGFDPKPFLIRTNVEAHPLRGFMNMGRFKVKGKNPITGRFNTRTVYAVDEAAALAVFRVDNPELVEPITATEIELPRPTPEQLEQAASCGQFIPEGAVMQDVEAALYRDECFGEPTIFRWQWEVAASHGFWLSALAGEQLARTVFREHHKRWPKEPPIPSEKTEER